MHLHTKWVTTLLISLLLSVQAYGAIEAHTFSSDVERKRYQSFVEELRCPKCQNQNLSGSDSPISADLRRELYEMIKSGKSDMEIVTYMVDRYGEFILYRPRITPVTYVLWGAPAVLLILGVVLLMVMLRQRRRLALTQSKTELNGSESERLRALLGVKKEPENQEINKTKT